MFRPISLTMLLMVSFGSALSQAPVPSPAFETASIKRIRAVTGSAAPEATDRSIRYPFVRLRSLVLEAYGIESYQLINGDRLGRFSDIYEIKAVLPDGSNRTQIPAMLRTLLAERFHLKVHAEAREVPAYLLTVAKGGLRLVPEVPGAKDTAEEHGLLWNRISVSATGRLHVEGVMTIAQFANLLSAPSSMDKPVLDMTGEQGQFRITFDALAPGAAWGSPRVTADSTGRAATNADSDRQEILPDGRTVGADAPSFATALGQLGMKLETRKVPFECIVVDSVSTEPTEN